MIANQPWEETVDKQHQQLQEIWQDKLRWYALRTLRHFLECLEIPSEVFIQLQNGGNIAAPIAVIGSRPHSDQDVIREPVLVPFLDQLMGSGDELKSVDVVKFLGDLRSEQPAYYLTQLLSAIESMSRCFQGRTTSDRRMVLHEESRRFVRLFASGRSS
jgi:hypothetical protein